MPEFRPNEGGSSEENLGLRVGRTERRVEKDLSGRRPWGVDRGVRADFPAPYEGQLLAERSTVYIWLEGAWRSIGASQFDIAYPGDDTQAVITGVWHFPIPDDLDGARLVGAEAGVFQPGSADVTVMVRNDTQAVDMLTDPITIDAGDQNSTDSGSPSAVDETNNTVEAGDWIELQVDGDGTAAELRVILDF